MSAAAVAKISSGSDKSPPGHSIRTIDNKVQVGIHNSDVTTDNPHYGLGLSVAISLFQYFCLFLNLP